ncbi:hypothetical protein ACLB2K_049779 [Fragaria x ananassa]
MTTTATGRTRPSRARLMADWVYGMAGCRSRLRPQPRSDSSMFSFGYPRSATKLLRSDKGGCEGESRLCCAAAFMATIPQKLGAQITNKAQILWAKTKAQISWKGVQRCWFLLLGPSVDPTNGP